MGVVGKKRSGGAKQDRILVVDPHEGDLEATSAVLREAGFRVVSLSRFEPTVPLFSVFRPGLVLLAAQPPELVSVGLARRIRQLSNGTTPIWYLIDEANADLRPFLLDKGMGLEVFRKPLDPAELVGKAHGQLRLLDAVEKSARSDSETRTPTLHDPLTGTHTRRFLLSLIGMETRRCERYGGNFSLVTVVVNGYPQLRKELGRDLAERLLVYVSVVLTQTVREADMVARVDDDAFALLLPGTPHEGVRTLQERLRSRFDLAKFQVEGKAYGTSVSVGAVSFPDQMGTATQLLAAALRELRRAKDSNRIGSGPVVTL